MNIRPNLLILCLVFTTSLVAQGASHSWGSLKEGPHATFTATVSDPQAGETILLPSEIGHLTRAYTVIERQRQALDFRIDRETNQLALILPTPHRPQSSLKITLETGSETTQHSNGRILLSSKDAHVEGATAKLESHEGNHRIGFWTTATDTVHWTYPATRPGMYAVHLTYSKAAGTETSVQVKAADSLAHATLTPTGSWYHYRTLHLGRVYIPRSGKTPVTVSCRHMDGVAVMNLKSIALIPTGEGNPIVQSIDGSVTLHANDVTVQSVKLQYESLPHKNTVGFWVNESDWAYWDFQVNRPGTFAVEILQGCGKGHGGSEVSLELGNQKLRFNVEETGHFQNFVPRYVGQMTIKRPDQHRLAIKPIHKAAGAVMDLRQIRLIPVLPSLK